MHIYPLFISDCPMFNIYREILEKEKNRYEKIPYQIVINLFTRDIN